MKPKEFAERLKQEFPDYKIEFWHDIEYYRDVVDVASSDGNDIYQTRFLIDPIKGYDGDIEKDIASTRYAHLKVLQGTK